MNLPFLLLLFSTFQLTETLWQCGADFASFSKNLAQYALGTCEEPVKNAINLCCKVHDNCYDHHGAMGYGKLECDRVFCRCLQDSSDKTKYDSCQKTFDAMCATVTVTFMHLPALIFGPSDHSKEYFLRTDRKPLNISMTSLINACKRNQRVIGHCHDSGDWCLRLEKHAERSKRGWHDLDDEREPYATRSWQDCGSMMYECLDEVVFTSDSDHCTRTARNMQEKLKEKYRPILLNGGQTGQAISEAYPILAARLLTVCTGEGDDIEDYLIRSFEFFDKCAKNDRRDARMYSSVRRIGIKCHQQLYQDILNLSAPEGEELNEYCKEARALAISRIRETELKY